MVRIAVENKMCDEGGATAEVFRVPQYLIYDKMNEVWYVNSLLIELAFRMTDEQID